MNDQQPARDPSAQSVMADAIMAYLLRDPDAMDTFEGISDWWLARHRVRVELEQLKAALDRLVETGKLEVLASRTSLCYRLRGPRSSSQNADENRLYR